jgi:hypothetical protein
MGECSGNSREILEVRNWKRKSLDRQVWRRHLKEASARLRAAALQNNDNNNLYDGVGSLLDQCPQRTRHKIFVCVHFR